jgi:hypothetical protein
MKVLEVNLRLAQVMEATQIHLKWGVEDEMLRNTSEMESHIQSMQDKIAMQSSMASVVRGNKDSERDKIGK